MPIRFRCAYCNQLMGIARRKAGTVVRCPQCSGEVMVPHPEDSSPQNPVEVRDSGLFEQSDFDDIFHDAAGSEKPASVKVKNTPAGAASADPKIEAEEKPAEFRQQELPAPAALPGILLSPTMATLLTVAIIVALALAFAGGLLLGRSMKVSAAATISSDKIASMHV